MTLERDTLAPEGLAPAIGFSHGIATRGGRIVWLAGQNGTDAQGRITAVGDLVAQTDQALANLIAVVEAAGGTAGDIVKLHLWVRDVAAYREGRRALGQVWRKHFGRFYPAMMLLGVTGFYDDEAEIEIDGYAVVADDPAVHPKVDPKVDPASPDPDPAPDDRTTDAAAS